MVDELTRIAVDLYTAPLSTFVSARTARAGETKDRELAGRIRALRKPSIAAWVVNVFARERADRLAQALRLAEELREAQADLDAATLATLGRQRRALTSQLAREAASLAKARGEKVTDSTLQAVQQTLSAAFFDPDAAAAVASGRLVRELEPSGEFPLDPGTIVGGGPPVVTQAPASRTDEVKARRERRDAERAVRAAEQELASAEREQDEIEQDRSRAADRVDRLAEHIAQLETQLVRARDEAEAAAATLDGMAARLRAAVDRAAAAEHDLSEARRALDDL